MGWTCPEQLLFIQVPLNGERFNQGDGFSIPDVVTGRQDVSTSRKMTQGQPVQRPVYSNELYLLFKNEYDLTSVKVPVHVLKPELRLP